MHVVLGNHFQKSGISNDGTTFKYIIERPLWVTLELVDQLKFFINERIIPVIPQQRVIRSFR